MKSLVPYISIVAVVLGLAGSLSAQTVTLKIEPKNYPIPPGEQVEYQVLCRVSCADNYGLATVGFDIETDTGLTQPTLVDGPAMAPFAGNGFTNPGNFDGQAVDDDVRGIGGAQNTIDNDGVSPPTPSGDVTACIGQVGWVVVATGHINLPSQESTYTVRLTNAFAGVLAASSGPIWPVAEASVVLESDSFQVTVSSTAPRVFAGTDQDVFEGLDVAMEATAATPSGGSLTSPVFVWQQLAGVSITLNGAQTANATFNAPTVNTVTEAAMSFRVTVSDGAGPQSSDSIDVRIHIAGDCSWDGNVDVVDLLIFVDAFGTALGDPGFNPLCDFNADTYVDVADLLIQVNNFGRSLTSDGGQEMMAGNMESQSQMSTGGALSGFGAQSIPIAGEMTLYEALEYAGLLDIYLDYIAEHPEDARTW